MLILFLLFLRSNAILIQEDENVTTNCGENSNCLECNKDDTQHCISCKPGFGLKLDDEKKPTGECLACK